MNHTIQRIDVAPAALEREAILSELQDHNLFRFFLATSISTYCVKHGKPAANDYAPIYMMFLDQEHEVEIMALCKPRACKPCEPEGETLGWAVALLTVEQSDALKELPSDEIDGRLTGYLGLEGADARLWTKRY